MPVHSEGLVSGHTYITPLGSVSYTTALIDVKENERRLHSCSRVELKLAAAGREDSVQVII